MAQSEVIGGVASTEHLRDLARLRRVRDRIDREYARPLDVEALARGAHMSAGPRSAPLPTRQGVGPGADLSSFAGLLSGGLPGVFTAGVLHAPNPVRRETLIRTAGPSDP